MSEHEMSDGPRTGENAARRLAGHHHQRPAREAPHLPRQEPRAGERLAPRPPPETIGWRRDDCPDREKGEAPAEPPLPPKPWFRLSRAAGTWHAVLVTDHGATYLRELGDHPNKAGARAAATAWARRSRVQYVEERPDWRR